MRLCVIADANSIHTRRWVEPLVERGYQIHLLSFLPVHYPVPGVEQLVDLTQIVNRRLVWLPVWTLWVRRFLRFFQPDVLHAHWIPVAGWIGMLSNYHPFVVTGWGSDVLLEPQRSFWRRYLVKLVLRECDHLTVPSRLMYNAARNLGVSKRRLHLIPWGVETEVFRPIPDDRDQTRRRLRLSYDAPVILCPRAVTEIYNHDVLLAAAKAILPQHPDLRLVLLRYNAHEEHLTHIEQQIKDDALEESVLWLPPQETSDDMARLYRMADVVASIPSSEGYGFTVYEAMACGTPTVISDLAIFDGEMVDGVHTLKVPARAAAETGQALERLLTDDSLRETLIENGLQVCQNKSVQVRIAQVEELYCQIAAQRSN